MRWTCPKCGKKLDISNKQLIANDGVIICPQCLLQARQPIPKTRVSANEDETRPPKHQTRSNSGGRSYQQQDAPPPHKTRMKQTSTPNRYTGSNDKSVGSNTRKKTSGKKKSKKKKQEGMTAMGCLGRTVIFTLVLFAAYVFFGLLLESLQ